MANNDNYDVNTFDFAFDEDGNGGFNSEDDLGIFLNHVSKPLAPNITESFQDVPKRYGGVYLGTDYGEKEFDIPITCFCTTRDEYNERIKTLTNVLVNTSSDADTEYPLRFNDDPDVTYYGHFTSIPTPTFINEGVQDFQTTLVFTLADPRGFLPQKEIKITDNDQQIIPEGNTEVDPIIHIIPKTDLYYVGYETNDDYVAVGYNVDDGDTATDSDGNVTVMGQSQTQQVDDPCNSLATWIQCSENTQAFPIYKGELDGKSAATGTSIMVAKDKDDHYEWGSRGKHKNFYGPAVMHNGLPKITPYWKVSVRLHHVKRMKNERAMGKIEAYLLDNNGNVCGRMGIEDYSMGRYPRAFIQLGNNFDSSNSDSYLTLLFDEGNGQQKQNEAAKHVKVAYTKTVTVKKKTAKKKKTTKKKK